MNKRQKDILLFLIKQKDVYVSMQGIASFMGCSEKTVRNDMKEIDRWVHEKGLCLIRKPSVGVRLDGTEDQLLQVVRDVTEEKDGQSTLTEDQRMKKTLLLLLTQSRPCTIQQLCETFYVHKNVIKKDLEQIEHWLKRFELTLQTKQKIGVWIEGNELKWRLAIARANELQTTSLASLFLPHEHNLVIQALRQYNYEHDAKLSDETMKSLAWHTLIAVKRIKMKNVIPLSSKEYEGIQEKKEYVYAQKITEQLEKKFVVKFPETEIAYLAIHLLGSKPFYETKVELDPNASEMVEFFIQEMSELTGYDFMSDVDLKKGLTLHITSTLHRLQHGLEVSNPMVQEIKKMYPYLFGLIATSIAKSRKRFPQSLPEEEAAYICLHFQAGYERLKKRNGNAKRILVSCAMGIGVSHLLKTKLERKFHSLEIVDVIPTSTISNVPMDGIDFVVSTSKIESISVPVIEVSPLLTDVEIQRIQQFIEENEQQMEFGDTKHSLHRYLCEDQVFIGQGEKHRFEWIEEVGNQLVRKKKITQDYIQSSIIRETLSSTAIGGGIAIPHGDPESVLESSISVMYLENPIDWEGQPVSLLFLLALKKEDTKGMKSLYQELNRLSDDLFLIDRLKKSSSKEEILQILFDQKTK